MLELTATNIDQKLVRQLAKKYNPLDYREQLLQLLTSVFPTHDFTKWEKVRMHELINRVVLAKDNGEQVLKYFLFHLFYTKNLVAAFEIKVNTSRADFVTINGSSKSYEIKSSLDNLYKLPKQSSDYLLAFDYNYLVIDDKHLKKAISLVPKCFGVWSFPDSGNKKIHRPAILNDKIDPEFQLRLLTKKERGFYFKIEKGSIEDILKEFTPQLINTRFKDVLKKRYQKRWEFIIANQNLILPIDLQFFFNYNIEPELIYN